MIGVLMTSVCERWDTIRLPGGANRRKTLLCDRNSICFTKLAFVFLVGGQTKRWISLCLSSSGVRTMLRRLFVLTHRGLSGSIPPPFNQAGLLLDNFT